MSVYFFKREPPLLQQIDVKLLEILSKFCYAKWKYHSSVLKIGYDHHLFSLLNFAGAAILDFMTSYGCRYCPETESTVDIMKSKMAALEKFESENRQ